MSLIMFTLAEASSEIDFMNTELDSYYLNKEEPNRSCLLALRDIILRQDEQVTETRKWGMPCFCLGKKIFCYLWIDKKTEEPYFLFVEGLRLNNPSLEQGDRKRMKIYRVNPNKDIPIDTIEQLLQAALKLARLT